MDRLPIIVAAPASSIGGNIKRGLDLSITVLIETVRILFFISPFILSLPQLAHAEDSVSFTETVEYVDGSPGENFIPWAKPAKSIANFGPFSVVTPQIIELNGAIDEDSPAQFRKLLALYPQANLLRMVECPGTENDDANLEVARMVRKAGINTLVPRGGSVRSGGVELFLAGVKRTAEPGAEIGVHSWQDYQGREAKDVPADDPIHAAYIRYYQEVGFTPDMARAFYAFTNQTPFDKLHTMTGAEIARYHLTN